MIDDKKDEKISHRVEVPVQPSSEQIVETKESKPEQVESVTQEQMRSLQEKVEAMDSDDSLKLQAQSHAAAAKVFSDEKKLDYLLHMAKEKGVVYAVSVAKKMGDPYLLDSLHDTLAKEGLYKEFAK
jgi:hypothetical protein